MSAHKHGHRPRHDHDDADHEHADINVRSIVMTGVGLLIVGVIVQIAMAGLFVYFERRAVRESPPLPPIATNAPRLSPQPALQANPAQELKVLREAQRLMLYSYGWIDQPNGVVHIPIDRAMKIMLDRGYPVRPGASDDPGERALGSSSGRFAPRGEP